MPLMTAAPSVQNTVPRRMPRFSPTREAAGLVFVSGQMAFDDQFQIIGADVVEQTRVCLKRIEAMLGTQGLSLADLVKTTVWLSRVDDFAAFDAAYGEELRGLTLPSRSTVRADLMVPGALVEIEAVAQRPLAAISNA
ncbi:RidA family protein [Chitinasiproducens palmae]|uniref:2-iminobutanoate/2-iminopropanoate deaminase n=1 Tax=Chitinasiproducens palmae TaxID=1770053 RepID=A0A1H2PVF8_9BURK|nr:RidA family protein [Chitinasiproducens palmae]SDV51249.1 2-iminobutanoate/2-iminopropanoate deaminase [Chitinasiproducens palmae]